MVICEYGCGREAKYKFKNGRWCCEHDYRLCPHISESKSVKMKKAWKNPNSKINSNEVRTKRAEGVKRSWDRDPERKKKLSEWNKENWEDKDSFFHTEQRREKISKVSQKYWDDPNSKFNSPEHGKKISDGTKLSIAYLEKHRPIFLKEEDIKEDPVTGELQVRCKNHNCKNSKELDGWFTPTKIQLWERMRSIYNGYGGGYLYCSQECKDVCPLFNPKKINPHSYIDSELQIFRHEVLERDDYKCLYCGEMAVHVHHIRTQKLEPFFALDPDYGISCCKLCHYKYAHGGEKCSTGYLSHKEC